MLYPVSATPVNNAPVKIPAGKQLLDIEGIVRMEAVSNYTHIYMVNGKKIVLAKTLKYFTSFLQPHGFIRCHRTHLLNPGHITRSNNGSILLANGELIEISRRKRRLMRLALERTA